MSYGLRQTVAAAGSPVSLSRVKDHLRLTSGSSDTSIEELYIPAAIDSCEIYTHRKFFTSTHELTLYGFPSCPIPIPYGQLQSIGDIEYADTAGNLQELSTSVWSVNAFEEPSQLTNKEAWPATFANSASTVIIPFTCGYGATWSSLPPSLFAAILLMVEHLYENRGPVVIGRTISHMPLSVTHLLDQNKLGDAYEWDG